jgi:putative Ca2+/H+ antiporter (TMEM165/GDT1 family)
MSIKLLTGISTYLLIVICELGDKTQFAVLLLTSRNPQKRWLLFLASSLALSLCVLVEVTVGVKLAQYLAPHIINKVAGIIFLLMGILGLWKELIIRANLNTSRNQSFVYEEANRS